MGAIRPVTLLLCAISCLILVTAVVAVTVALIRRRRR